MPAFVSNIIVTCKQCGKDIPVKPHKATQQFCSQSCKHVNQKRPTRLRTRRPKKTYGDRQCSECNNQYVAKQVGQKYCSAFCARASVHRRNIIHLPNERTCEFCCTAYTTKIGRAAHLKGSGGRRFCSIECQHNSMKGNLAPNWNGGKHQNESGYVNVLVDGRYILEHRYVMEQRLGRPLTETETVHHVNGIKHDNRDENLELWNSRHPKGQRVLDLLAWAGEFLPLYGLRVVEL